MTEKIPFLFFSLPGFTCLPQSKLFCGRLFNMLKHKTSSEGFFFSLFCCPSCGFYVKFGVQSCLKINTCVRWSDVLCGFQPGKWEKKQNKTNWIKVKLESTTLPTKICMLWDGLLKSPIYFRLKKKKKRNRYLYSKCWMSLEGWVTFCTIHANVDAYQLFFFFSSFMETCSAAARVSGYWWVLRCCSSLHSLCSADKSTHQHTRGVFLSLSLFPPPVVPPSSPWKTAVNGSSCNPSSGNVYFFLFKISFRYLSKCCCSSFTLVILTLWFSIFFFFSLLLKVAFSILW